MKKILIVEDEQSMLIGLKDNFEFEGYDVETSDSGDKGLLKIKTNRFDLVILDVMLPGISGFDILRMVRNQGITTPIILLTAKGQELDKVIGLELGADDYITKPFSLRELLARVKAILRRTGNTENISDHNEIQIGKLSISFESFEASENGNPVKLSHKEFEILKYLYKKSNQIVTRDQLLDEVWGIDYQPASRTIDNFILRLRSKVDTENTNHIVTVHGYGYKLIP